MQRSDRLLGMTLALRSGKTVPATELARRFEVSIRTVYRDMDTLSALGVPVYAEPGRGGGYRLLEGYFLPAIAFTRDEAVSLLLALALLRSLGTRPLAAGLETAGQKLLAAMPAHLSTLLASAEQLIGFESPPADVFHEELAPAAGVTGADEAGVIDVFLRAILDGDDIAFMYRSPYRPNTDELVVHPRGIFWDRGWWYLAADVRPPRKRRTQLFRADRVTHISRRPRCEQSGTAEPFDVRDLLGRRWLAAAMANWRTEDAIVRIRMTPAQADRLQRDWYYAHARFEPDGENVIMTYADIDGPGVLQLARWLGPGAELLDPPDWRAQLRDELRRMADDHDNEEDHDAL